MSGCLFLGKNILDDGVPVLKVQLSSSPRAIEESGRGKQQLFVSLLQKWLDKEGLAGMGLFFPP